MRSFESDLPPHDGQASVSLKIRVTSGCFHREHSPRAYALIDRQLASLPPAKREFAFIEHESGPEVVAYVTLAAGVTTLAASILDLIAAIIRARSEGVREGDHPSDPVELIVRRVAYGDTFAEEKILRIGHQDTVDRTDIKERVDAALDRLADDKGHEGGPGGEPNA